MGESIVVGRIGRAHGLGGEVYVLSESDTPDRFNPGAVFLTEEEPPRRLEVRWSGQHQAKLLVAFVGITDRSDAEALRGVVLTMSAGERRKLNDDEYWPDELVGMTVRNPAGEALGEIAEVDTSGPQNRLVVRTIDNRLALVPFVRALVPEVNAAERWVVVDPIDGLLNPPPE